MLIFPATLRRFGHTVKINPRLLRPYARQGIRCPMLIYKIFRADEWQSFQVNGVTEGAPIDITDGFVHFSTAGQVRETAARHFAGEENLFLLALEADALGAELKWEASRGGQDFPHLYRSLTLQDILWSRALPLVDGTHQFPEDLA